MTVRQTTLVNNETVMELGKEMLALKDQYRLSSSGSGCWQIHRPSLKSSSRGRSPRAQGSGPRLARLL